MDVKLSLSVIEVLSVSISVKFNYEGSSLLWFGHLHSVIFIQSSSFGHVYNPLSKLYKI